MRIGVLALQGAFAEHVAVLRQLDTEATEVRLPGQLAGLDGLIIPGGETTTITNLMLSYDFREEIARLAKGGLPVFGTCAGMVLLASEVIGNGFQPVAAMSIAVRRNAFGRQLESFENELSIPALGEAPFPGVFIRAPIIERADDGVEVLARLSDGTMVAARQDKLLVCAFHPELTEDRRFHQYFLNIVAG
jgi:5'-phosphate synthase pdxT subunit